MHQAHFYGSPIHPQSSLPVGRRAEDQFKYFLETEGILWNGFVTDIHPRHGEKFSPNFHSWLRVHPHYTRVFRVKKIIDHSWNWTDADLLVGMLDKDDSGLQWFVGARLNEILTNGSAASAGAYALGSRVEFNDVTKEFWPEYLRVGRCAVDPDHQENFRKAESRYSTESGIRTCSWCGMRHQVIPHSVVTSHSAIKYVPLTEGVAS